MIEPKRIVTRRRAAVERLAMATLNIILDWEAIDNYWLDLPISQRDLSATMFLRDRCLPPGALDEIADVVAPLLGDLALAVTARRTA